MGLNFSNKVLDRDEITCGEDFFVTLGLSASPNIQNNPTDIVLVLDRSGSMAGLPLEEVKVAAKTFIDIIDENTDGDLNQVIGNGSRIGIVSFSTVATKDVPLTTNVVDLKSAIDALVAGGSTNHADAFRKARELFNPLSTNDKVIIMFTDGKTTAGTDPSIEAKAARDEGITIYCIGLTGSDGIDVTTLNDWATDPDSAHVVVTPDPQDLEQIFGDLAANISKPGATNIVINEILNDDFNIIDIIDPNLGSVTLINDTELRWTIDGLGKTSNEGASLKFKVKHIGNSSGVMEVNKYIQYMDNEGNIATFGNPEITVYCNNEIPVDPCPTPKEIVFNGCHDHFEYDLGDYTLSDLGSILDLSLTIKNVCPNKDVAVAITLTEVDCKGVETKKGMKIIAVPAHNGSSCKDIKLTNIRFILPEENGYSFKTRKFLVGVIANYTNNNHIC